MSHVWAFSRRENATGRVKTGHGAAVAPQRKLAQHDVRRDRKSVVHQLIDDESDHLVHVDLLSFDFNRDIRFVSSKRAVVRDAHRLARAVVARNGALKFGVIILGEDDDGLFEGRSLLRRDADDALLDGIVVGD